MNTVRLISIIWPPRARQKWPWRSVLLFTAKIPNLFTEVARFIKYGCGYIKRVYCILLESC